MLEGTDGQVAFAFSIGVLSRRHYICWFYADMLANLRIDVAASRPYWSYDYSRPHLIIPYTLDNNDMRFSQSLGRF